MRPHCAAEESGQAAYCGRPPRSGAHDSAARQQRLGTAHPRPFGFVGGRRDAAPSLLVRMSRTTCDASRTRRRVARGQGGNSRVAHPPMRSAAWPSVGGRVRHSTYALAPRAPRPVEQREHLPPPLGREPADVGEYRGAEFPRVRQRHQFRRQLLAQAVIDRGDHVRLVATAANAGHVLADADGLLRPPAFFGRIPTVIRFAHPSPFGFRFLGFSPPAAPRPLRRPCPWAGAPAPSSGRRPGAQLLHVTPRAGKAPARLASGERRPPLACPVRHGNARPAGESPAG